jgi:hypothetical protein
MLHCWGGLEFPKAAEIEYTHQMIYQQQISTYNVPRMHRGGVQAQAALSSEMPRYPLYRRVGGQAPQSVWRMRKISPQPDDI